ncbi:MAG: hypothetical protein O2951_10175 [Bacteroidetes bacterium]|nr:hypothetical protein [Bacteroidota bacterium]
MKKYIFILLAFTFPNAVYSQPGGNPEAQQKIEAARIALITERLGLTPDQAEKFWPVYKEFSDKRQETRQGFMEQRRKHNPQTASEEENRRLVQLGLEVKERELNLEKEYSERLLRVIDNRQLISLRQAEDDFRQMILRRIEQQRNRREQFRDRNQDQIERRRNN